MQHELLSVLLRIQDRKTTASFLPVFYPTRRPACPSRKPLSVPSISTGHHPALWTRVKPYHDHTKPHDRPPLRPRLIHTCKESLAENSQPGRWQGPTCPSPTIINSSALCHFPPPTSSSHTTLAIHLLLVDCDLRISSPLYCLQVVLDSHRYSRYKVSPTIISFFPPITRWAFCFIFLPLPSSCDRSSERQFLPASFLIHQLPASAGASF